MKHRDSILALLDDAILDLDAPQTAVDLRRARAARALIAGGSYTVMLDVGAALTGVHASVDVEAFLGATDQAYDLPIVPKRPQAPAADDDDAGDDDKDDPDPAAQAQADDDEVADLTGPSAPIVTSKILKVACPTCGSAAGIPCRDGDHQPCTVHPDRRRAANAHHLADGNGGGRPGESKPGDTPRPSETRPGGPRPGESPGPERPPRPTPQRGQGGQVVSTRGSAGKGQRLSDEAIRDAIVDLGTKAGRDGFSGGDLARALGVAGSSARRYLMRWVDDGRVTTKGTGARMRYVYVDPRTAASGPTRRPNGADKVDADVAAAALRAAGRPVPDRGAPVAGVNGSSVSSDRRVRDLVDEIRRLNGAVEIMGDGHLRVKGPKGFATIASTPGGSGPLRKTRRAIKQHTGLMVSSK